ncbi:TPA: hypothetical protein U2L65_001928 [Citrobacter farmeri]|uniref:T6SS effector BTH_I2691 family protein n=1 Tax=Citrobacter farmeri TaxID=67824 RepID=UPI001E40AC93|nr:T6SS effector BTH_I2691 family protein [Citrobacter farmeri]GJL48294.1 hypothetical protein TUM17580_43530 [Citrobacter farmeri]HCD7254272.1 hypothetical protein [Citrobacter farmeri]HCD7628315.1 hypothetical protein [Citrobacter farmeri]HEM7970911.1 hypothetical protein [Citrobacter farmeri]HEM7985154.1 hypothetical protein [Citrobacter farmeri]
MACNNQCKTVGLTVLPVRYAVVPDTLNPSLPAWAEDASITGVKLAEGEKYALRSLRQGYLYVFYEQGKQGANYWQCYSVGPEGFLWLQQVVANPASVTKPQCADNINHSSQNVEFLSIETPEQCGNVWFAFSQYPWGQETLDRYKNQSDLRQARMQKINPQAWINTQSAIPGTVATQASIRSVLDYQTPSVAGMLPGHEQIYAGTLSKAPPLKSVVNTDVSYSTIGDTAGMSENVYAYQNSGSAETGENTDWSFNDAVLTARSTLHPWTEKKDAGATLEHMQARSVGSQPLLLPLWDAVGIVHELNGWCQDVLGRQAQFMQERSTELATTDCLNSAKHTIKNLTDRKITSMTERMSAGGEGMLSEEFLAARMSNAEKVYGDRPAIMAQVKEDNALLASWRGQGISSFHIEELMSSIPTPLQAHREKVEEIKAQVAREQASRPAAIKAKYAQDWSIYQSRLNSKRQASFERCHQKLLRRVNEVLQQRMISVMAWLEAPLLQITLDDMHSEDPNAGEYYQSAVMLAMMGINHCPVGKAKLQEWWDAFSTGDRGNLVWRMFSANKPSLVAELEVLLQTVKPKKDEQITPENAGVVMQTVLAVQDKLKAYSGYYVSSTDTLSTKLRDNASALELKLYTVDTFVVTLGDSILSKLHLDRVGTSMTTALFNGLTALRAGIPAEKAAMIMQEYFQSAPEMRTEIQKAIELNNKSLPTEAETRQIKTKALKGIKEYEAGMKGSNELKGARINGLLFVLNAAEFAYLYSQSEHDKKAQAAMVMTAMAGATVLLDALKPLLSAGEGGEQRLSYLMVKGAGGLLGGFVSGMSAYTDIMQTAGAFDDNRLALAGVKGLKTASDAATAIKFAGLFLECLRFEIAEFLAGKISLFLAWSIFGVRVLACLITWEAQIAILLLETAVTLMTDNDLQRWCSQCVFGVTPKNICWKEQSESFDKAIKDVA